MDPSREKDAATRGEVAHRPHIAVKACYRLTAVTCLEPIGEVVGGFGVVHKHQNLVSRIA
jgi:hypothetical protein